MVILRKRLIGYISSTSYVSEFSNPKKKADFDGGNVERTYPTYIEAALHFIA